MNTMTKNNLLFIILSILVIFFWQKIITIESESEQFNLLFISCSAFIFSVILSKKFILSRQQQQILHSVIGILTISILLISWNSIFRWYSDTHDFKGNIFTTNLTKLLNGGIGIDAKAKGGRNNSQY